MCIYEVLTSQVPFDHLSNALQQQHPSRTIRSSSMSYTPIERESSLPLSQSFSPMSVLSSSISLDAEPLNWENEQRHHHQHHQHQQQHQRTSHITQRQLIDSPTLQPTRAPMDEVKEQRLSVPSTSTSISTSTSTRTHVSISFHLIRFLIPSIG